MRAIKNATYDALGWFAISLSTFIGFTLLAVQLFGSYDLRFSTVNHAVQNLLLLTTGGISPVKLLGKTGNSFIARASTAFFVFAFMTTFYFVFFDMLLVIVHRSTKRAWAMEDARDAIEKFVDRFDMRRCFSNMLRQPRSVDAEIAAAMKKKTTVKTDEATKSLIGRVENRFHLDDESEDGEVEGGGRGSESEDSGDGGSSSGSSSGSDSSTEGARTFPH